MSKVIAVIDKPKNCEHCPCFEDGMFIGVCRLEKQTKSNTEKGIPDWCPLREVPQRAYHPDWCDNGRYDKGYNVCIDEIMKGSEENG